MKRKIEDTTYLKSHELLNRMVMPPMERARAFKDGDTPVAIMDTYYRQRAKTGLIISEPIYVSDNSRINMHTSYINKKAQINAWRKINQNIEDDLGVIFACLAHGGSYAHPEFNKGKKASSPSGIFTDTEKVNFDGEKFIHKDIAKELSTFEIEDIIADYEQASQNAFDAMFHGVQIDFASHGLLNEFLDPNYNNRDDDYAFNRNHSLIAENIIKKVVDVYGRDSVSIRVRPEHLSILKSIITDNAIAMVQIDGELKSFDAISEIRAQLPNISFCYEGELDHKLYASLLNDRKFDLIAIKDYFVTNPDLAARIRKGLPLTSLDGRNPLEGKEDGYIDYPDFRLKAM